MQTIDAVKSFLSVCAAKGLSDQTSKWYKSILNQFAVQNPELPEIPEPIYHFISSCKAGDERRHGYFRAVRAMYNYLERRLNLVPNPMLFVSGPKCTKKNPQPIYPPDVTKVWLQVSDPYIKAGIQFLIDTGARLGELHGLAISDLFETPWGYMAKISGKTGERIVPICYETYHQMMVTLPFPYSKDWLGRKIAEAFRSSGVKGSAHRLRHTFGTYWTGDIDVLQNILGHSTISTTLRYRQLRIELMAMQHHRYSPARNILSGQISML